MEGNDLDNHPAPRLLVVFEDLVGVVPPEDTRRCSGYINRGKWDKALGLFETNPLVADRFWYLTLRTPYQVDLLTWQGIDFAKAIRNWVQEHDIAIARVTWQGTPEQFGRKVSYMPYVAAVYGPNPQHVLTIGSKYHLVSPHDPKSLDQIGRF